MTKEEAIKYLQQLYPNGGHCWLDEQRIEAIDMAIEALQEEPVSEVWHYQKNEPISEITDKLRPIVVVYGDNSLNAAGEFRCYENNSDAIWLSGSYEKWAFVEDLINLSHLTTKIINKESVSDDMEEFATWYADGHYMDFAEQGDEDYWKTYYACIAGAEWQKEQPRKGLVDINSVCGWIITHINDYLIDGTILGTSCATIDTDDLVKELRKAMEEDTESCNITGIGSKHAEGKLKELLDKKNRI